MVKKITLIVFLLSSFASLPSSAKVGIAFDFDQRFYILKDVHQNIWGYRGGPYINKKIKCGIGMYYGLNHYSISNVQQWAADLDIRNNFMFELKQYGTSIYAEPVFYIGKYSEWSLVGEMAYFKNKYTIINQNRITNIKTSYIPASIGISTNLKFAANSKFKPFRWIGVNLMAGYRFDLYQSNNPINLEGIHLSASGALFLDRIWQDLTSKAKNN